MRFTPTQSDTNDPCEIIVIEKHYGKRPCIESGNENENEKEYRKRARMTSIIIMVVRKGLFKK